MNEKIDFVITWVDGNDKEWLNEKNKYVEMLKKKNSQNSRYRDWSNLQYWFRGVEKFAPWVNKIYFITWGHIPSWLNIENEKLVIVKHEDYIPKEYLPTFNSNAIELNLHRIEGLSEQFVYFNDDMFLINDVKETDFFKNGMPCDSAVMLPISSKKRDNFIKVVQSDVTIINSYFDKNMCIKRNFFKWFNPKYGADNLKTLCLMPFKLFPGIDAGHLPIAFNKNIFEIIWEKEYEILEETSRSKFRDNNTNINVWLMKYWQLVTGKFNPRNAKFGKYFAYSEKEEINLKIYEAIRKQKYKMICLNDVEENFNFEKEKNRTIKALNEILPERSRFEK